MPIRYALVAVGTTVLAEHSAVAGNFSSVAQAILNMIAPNSDSRLSYASDRYMFHYISQFDGASPSSSSTTSTKSPNANIIALCATDDNNTRRIPFAFLEDVITRFRSTIPLATIQASANTPHSLAHVFNGVLAHQIDFYNTSPSVDVIRQAQNDLAQVRDGMSQNIERILERGGRMETLLNKTDNLSSRAFAFKKRSTALRRAMWWKNVKLMALLGFVVLVIVYFMSVQVCGFPAWHNCRPSAPSKPQPEKPKPDNPETGKPEDGSEPKQLNPETAKSSSVEHAAWLLL
ncbi:synaptobrevin-domain-containing protein [Ramicandelaber brevisporus]|nr:synaptobrevin-domain-containing protein [Ramicandelaber brevisporus]